MFGSISSAQIWPIFSSSTPILFASLGSVYPPAAKSTSSSASLAPKTLQECNVLTSSISSICCAAMTLCIRWGSRWGLDHGGGVGGIFSSSWSRCSSTSSAHSSPDLSNSSSAAFFLPPFLLAFFSPLSFLSHSVLPLYQPLFWLIFQLLTLPF